MAIVRPSGSRHRHPAQQDSGSIPLSVEGRSRSPSTRSTTWGSVTTSPRCSAAQSPIRARRGRCRRWFPRTVLELNVFGHLGERKLRLVRAGAEAPPDGTLTTQPARSQGQRERLARATRVYSWDSPKRYRLLEVLEATCNPTSATGGCPGRRTPRPSVASTPDTGPYSSVSPRPPTRFSSVSYRTRTLRTVRFLMLYRYGCKHVRETTRGRASP